MTFSGLRRRDGVFHSLAITRTFLPNLVVTISLVLCQSWIDG